MKGLWLEGENSDVSPYTMFDSLPATELPSNGRRPVSVTWRSHGVWA